jgi:predicted Rossmann fold nucleotide-binding protein DprA/Smf involved in DNA uptake
MPGRDPVILVATDSRYPMLLQERLDGTQAPQLTAIGKLDLLGQHKVALFCSARTPGDAILRAHDAARHMRDEGIVVISGFHSPIEKDCLRILLRGTQPIIICPGRAIDAMRIPIECRSAFEAGRLLFVSPFTKQPTRVTKDSAARRNEVVAAMADEAYVAYASPGGQTVRIVEMLDRWRIPIVGPPDTPARSP